MDKQMTFSDLGLKPEILSALDDLGFQSPTEIQALAIPHVLERDEDLVALAQTGTGKTASFGLPLLQELDPQSRKVQAMILAPTRELCLQISNDIRSFSKNIKGLHVVSVYGGASIVDQMKQLQKGGQIVVGTPGRTLDLINRKKLQLDGVQWMVLDEADEMLSMGFKEDLDAILSATPEHKQTLFFSATMPREAAMLVKKYMHEPVEISVGRKNEANKDVTHQYYLVAARDRYLALKRLADMHADMYGIVFCRTRNDTKEVADKLMADGYNADALHGELSQNQRDYVMNRFRDRKLQMLVATDVAARGLDVNELTHVINYSLPDDPEVYVHRSGRTGRAGSKGLSVSLIHSRETHKLRNIQKMIGADIELKKVPSGEEICRKQLFRLVDKVEKVQVDQEGIGDMLPEIYEKLSWMTREQLIQHFVSVEFNRFLDYYKGAGDINLTAKEKGKGGKETRQGKEVRSKYAESREQRKQKGEGATDFVALKINLGGRQGMNPKRLLSLINRNVPRGLDIGRIDIQRDQGFFEVEAGAVNDVLNGFKKSSFRGKRIHVHPAK